MKSDLDTLRSSIEKMDKEILQAINERMLLSQQIGKLKKDLSIPIQYPEIESTVRKRYLEYGASHKILGDFCEALAKIILEESVRIQENP